MFVLIIFLWFRAKKNRSMQKRHQIAVLCAQDLTITDACPIFTDICSIVETTSGVRVESFWWRFLFSTGGGWVTKFSRGQTTTRVFYEILPTVGQTPAGIFYVRGKNRAGFFPLTSLPLSRCIKISSGSQRSAEVHSGTKKVRVKKTWAEWVKLWGVRAYKLFARLDIGLGWGHKI